MRRNGSDSEHIKTETKWNGKAQRARGLSKRHKIALSSSALQNGNRSCMERHIGIRNYIWSCHLIKALSVHGRLIWIFMITDEYTQECLLRLADHYISNQNVIDELFSLFLQRGIPKYLVTFGDDDSMPKALCEWIGELELNGTFVELKKYGENGYGTLFIKKFMKDLFAEKSFESLADVKLWLANWKDEYNRSINLMRI